MRAGNWMRNIVAAAVLAGAGKVADAAIIYSIASTSASTTWNTASIWDNNQAPSSGNDYVSAHTLRTATTFAGASLTVNTNGIVALKQGTTTINNLHMAGGTIQNYYNDNATANLAGTLYIDAPTTINASDPDNRTNAIAAIIYGDDPITTASTYTNKTSKISITGTNNPFTGGWIVSSGLLLAAGTGSLGSGDITVNSGARFDANYGINNPDSSLTLNGVMVLDQDHAFLEVTIAGTSLDPGAYTFSQLNTQFDANFDDAGSGSITVVPEPSVLAGSLLLAGLMGLRRRR